jgi:hypothetical protein
MQEIAGPMCRAHWARVTIVMACIARDAPCAREFAVNRAMALVLLSHTPNAGARRSRPARSSNDPLNRLIPTPLRAFIGAISGSRARSSLRR